MLCTDGTLGKPEIISKSIEMKKPRKVFFKVMDTIEDAFILINKQEITIFYLDDIFRLFQ